MANETIPELIPLDEAKTHLRLGDDTAFDGDVRLKLDGAVSIAESYLNRILRQRDITVSLPVSAAISLRVVPVSDILSVAYESLGQRIELEKSMYRFIPDEYCPQVGLLGEVPSQTVEIGMRCGYDSKTLPPAIKMGILFMLGTLFDNESDNLVGRSVSQLPLSAERILSPWRIEPY